MEKPNISNRKCFALDASTSCDAASSTRLLDSRRQNAEVHGANSSGGVLTASRTAGSVSLASGATLAVPVRRIVTFYPGELSGFLFALPALHSLRESFPGARICAVLRPSLAPFLRDSPLCDEVWERPKGGISRQTSLMLQLRAWQPDLTVGFSRSRISTLLAWSSGAEERLGFEGARLESLLTQSVWCETFDVPEAPLALVRALGCRIEKTDARDLISIGAQHEAQAAKLLDVLGLRDEFVVAMCDSAPKNPAPFAPEKSPENAANNDFEYSIGGFSSNSFAARGPNMRHSERASSWTTLQWARTISGLRERAPVVLIGAKTANAVVETLARFELEKENADKTDSTPSSAPQPNAKFESENVASENAAIPSKNTARVFPVADLGGQLELAVIAAIMRRAALFIGADSGILQLAAAVATPIVGLWSAEETRRQPRGVPFRAVAQSEIFDEKRPLDGNSHYGNNHSNLENGTDATEKILGAVRELLGL